MKKRQKIIVVISCFAVIVSVLAVNCFAWGGSGSHGVVKVNPLQNMIVDFGTEENISVVADYPSVISDYRVSFPVNGYVPSSSFGQRTNIILLDMGDSQTWSLATLWQCTSNTSSQFKNYYMFDALSYNPFGEQYSIQDPRAREIILQYGEFSLENWGATLNDTYTLRSFSDTIDDDGNYNVYVDCLIDIPVALIDGSKDIYEVISIPIHAYTELAVSANFNAFSSVSSVCHYEFGGQTYQVENVSLIGSHLKDLIDNYYSFLDGVVYLGHGSVISADVMFYGLCSGIAINSKVTENNASVGYNELEADVTVEEIVQVVEEVQVEPFEWIIQAIDGVLDTELFGTLTIGHLILCAIAIPALLAILRAIAGG